MERTLEEAIKYYSELAEENEKDAEQLKRFRGTQDMISHCYECAEEHRQLAELLKELKRWREFGRNNAQFINDCLIQNHIDKLFSSEIKNNADILRIVNEALTLRTTNEFCKSFNEQFEDNVCNDCYYNDGDVHAECVICDKAESEK